MARRVIDDAVLLSTALSKVRETEAYKAGGYETSIEMVSDKTPSVSLKKSTVTVELKLINPVIDVFNRISIDDNACFIETPNGDIPISKGRMRVLKAVLSCTSGTSPIFTNCCKVFSQHILTQCMRKAEASGLISTSGDELVDKIYEELSDFYVNNS